MGAVIPGLTEKYLRLCPGGPGEGARFQIEMGGTLGGTPAGDYGILALAKLPGLLSAPVSRADMRTYKPRINEHIPATGIRKTI